VSFNFNISFGHNPTPYNIKYQDGFFYRIFNGFRSKKIKDYDKMELVLSSPAVMFVFKLIAEYYAMGKYNSYVDNRLSQEDYMYERIGNPNQWQTWSDFDQNYIFNILMGNAYLYEQNEVMYFLQERCITLTSKQRESFKVLSFSKYGQQSKKSIQKGTFEYHIGNETQKLDLSKLWIIQDTSGVNGDWFAGVSRLDALYEVVTNSNLAISAENVNLEFSQKFLVSGQHDKNDITSQMMGKEERNSLENNARGNKNMWATGSKVDVHHFVDNIADLKLDDSFFAKIYIIAKMYNIPKDIVEMSLKGGATFENQEKALGRFIDYCLKPLSLKLTDTLENIFDLQDLRKEFTHLSFNKIFEQEREDVRATQIANLQASAELGMDATIVQQKLKEIWELD
jgi:portal protein